MNGLNISESQEKLNPLSIWRTFLLKGSINLAYGKLHQFGVSTPQTLSIWRMENSINLAYLHRRLYQFGVWKTPSIWRIYTADSINLAYGKLHQFGVWKFVYVSRRPRYLDAQIADSINLAYRKLYQFGVSASPTLSI